MRTRMSMYAMLACLLLFALFPSTASAADSPELTAASVTGEGHVELTFSKAMAAPPEGAAGFAVFGFGSIPVLSSVLDPGDNTKILLTIADPISGGESAYLDYTPGTVKSADGEMLAAINNFSISNDLPHPTIDTTALPEGEVGTPYFYSFTTTGGTPPYTYSIYYGALPPGLVLQKSTGILSGTPTTDGTFGDSPLIRISVRDANNALGIRNITIVISESSGTEYPTVTGEATDVSWTSAQLSGSVAYSNGGSITERGFVYDTDDGPTTVSGTKIVCGAGAGDFSASVTGLQPSKRYCVRAYAIYGGGTVCYSNQIVVNTKSGTLPHVSTIPVNDTALTGATLRGNVTYDGGTEVTERGFVYGRESEPAIGGAGVTKVTAGSGTGIYSLAVTGLDPDTTYHVRAYAINGVGLQYSGDMTFTTLSTNPVPPTVVTNATFSVSSSGATLAGNVTLNGGAVVTEYGFVYGRQADPRIGGTGVTRVAAGSGTGSFAWTIDGLDPGTDYHVCAYAINSAGTAYGTDVRFSTSEDESADNPKTGRPEHTGWLLLSVWTAGTAGLISLRRKRSRR